MNYKSILTLISAFLIIIGCKTKKHVIYQSRANIEFKSDTKRSTLEKIGLSEEKEPLNTRDARNYSVFYGNDNGENEYILFAPTIEQKSGITASIEQHQYSLSVPFSKEKASEFLDILNSNIRYWNQNIAKVKGKFSSYNYTPEYETVNTSDSTAFYGMPSFGYNFSKSAEGNSLSITLSKGSILWETTMKEKEKMDRLRALFQKAVNKVKK